MSRTSLAMCLLVAGNLLALISDAFVKAYSSEVPVAQFVLIRTLITLIFLSPFVVGTSISQLKKGWKLQLIRAQISIVGIVCMVVALHGMSLATANAIFYIAPIIVMLLAVLVFGERLTKPSVVAVISGFVGVLVILRPTAIQWHSVAAIVVAGAIAINIILIRKLPASQTPFQMLFVMHLFMLPVLGLLTVFQWQPVAKNILIGALGSSFFILCYNLIMLLAYRLADANKITSSEYTGMIWAIFAGWLVFGEVPDIFLLVGSAMIILPLVWLALTEQRMIKLEYDLEEKLNSESKDELQLSINKKPEGC